MFTTDRNTPPNIQDVSSSIFYWERQLDPWHIDAFPKEWDMENATIVAIGPVDFKKNSPRVEGWMGIDWCENPLGFIPDGSQFDGEPSTKYVLRDGPYGHLCAYPEGSEKLKEHEGQDWRRKD